jgi:hypothetical protein
VQVKTHKLPPTLICPTNGCGKALDSATGGAEAPKEDDVTICAYCSTWLKYGDGLELVELSEQDIEELDDELFNMLVKFSKLVAEKRKARQ